MPIPKVRIITNAVSDGARALADSLIALGATVSRVRTGTGPKRPSLLNIKWGCFALDPTDYGGVMLNHNSGETSLNKLTCFNVLRTAGVPVPDFTTDINVARGWMRTFPCRIYERHSLRGSEGDGIRVVGLASDGTPEVGSESELSAAPLYVKAMRGIRREYRIHVFNCDGVKRVFIQQKKRRAGADPETRTNGTIRNLANGWIFAHNDIVAPRQQTIDAAVGAIQALRLNFGGVDLIEMDDVTGGSVVLEINCAPGLQGGTLAFYAEAIQGVILGVVDNTPPTEAVYEDDDINYTEEDLDNDF